ncbi:MAG: cation:proton antiporter [Anaerolineae bacterium]|nr:cation:proton antiporter [Anaerolineae bacterium]MCO5191103.1 cation:proton antiporter [Anaerolineae bacterium]MCO5193715.1 cation:proton antiporter [Anaerolineae bacterium]MCO5196704.1 cation:proton antiporter [Anaerolineae bacterium]MCO5206810.1 cation:proton antiporter [Anaerolineae bacterium]
MLQTISWYFALPGLTLAVILTFVRVLRGPTMADRVVAIDLMASLAIGIIAVYAIASDNPQVLDIALVLALLSFLGTVAFGFYLERFR